MSPALLMTFICIANPSANMLSFRDAASETITEALAAVSIFPEYLPAKAAFPGDDSALITLLAI